MKIDKKINISKTIFICSNTVIKKNSSYFNNLKNKSNLLLIINSKLPDYIYLKKKYELIKHRKFDNIFAIGGGKTIDSAKTILTFFIHNKQKRKLYIIPTLLGSGAEITNSAVNFQNKKKNTIVNLLIKPKKIFYSQFIFNKAPSKFRLYSALDCLCQSIESIWSKKSNKLSIKLASQSFKDSMFFLKLNNNQRKKGMAFKKLCNASLNVGKAMNITRTTAPHALSYSLTSHLELNHGLAVSLLMKILIFKNLENLNKHKKIIILKLFKVRETYQVAIKFSELLKKNQINYKLNLSKNQIDKFVSEINIERLDNNPCILTKDYIKYTYSIL